MRSAVTFGRLRQSSLPPARLNLRWKSLASLLVEKRPHFPGPGRVLEFPQGFGFNLPDPLARHRELLADFLERVVGVHADADSLSIKIL